MMPLISRPININDPDFGRTDKCPTISTQGNSAFNLRRQKDEAVNATSVADSALPHLNKALDPYLMREVFSAILFNTVTQQQRYCITACEMMQTRYKPGKNCLLTYRLKIHDATTKQDLQQILCARMYEKGGSEERFNKARKQAFITPPSGAPLMHIPALEMVIWSFPNERKLAALPVITCEERLRHEILPAVIAENFGNEWEIADLKNELIHYVAEHTCTVRVTLQLHQSNESSRQTCVLFGKTYYNDQGADTFRLMQRLSHSEASRSEHLLTALPLAWQPKIRTLWQMGLPGSSLYDQPLNSPHFAIQLEQAAKTLAALHTADVSVPRAVSTRDLLARLLEAEATIVTARPQIYRQLRALIERLHEQSANLQSRPEALLHGDLHLKNFLATGENVALIDLDNCCLGDPLLDLGSFIAALQCRDLINEAFAPSADLLSAAFIRAYQQNIRWRILPADLSWYIAYALIAERACRCITRLKTQQTTALEKILAMVGQIVNRHTGGYDHD